MTCATDSGAAACSQGGRKRTATPPRGLITTGAAFGPDGSIVTPGNTKFTANGNPEVGPIAPKRYAVGWPLTTGTVRMDDNIGTVNQPNPTAHFTAFGYDNRASDGYIKLVGASFAWGGTSGATYTRATQFWIAPGAAAVAGPGVLVALGILAGGYALRRKMLTKR